MRVRLEKAMPIRSTIKKTKTPSGIIRVVSQTAQINQKEVSKYG